MRVGRLCMAAVCALGVCAASQGDAENIIHNSSFEVGLQGWSCYTRGSGGYPNDISVVGLDPRPECAEADGAPDGRRALRLVAPDHCGFAITSRAYEAMSGRYVLGAAIRSGVALKLELIDATTTRGAAIATIEVAPSGQWTAVTRRIDVPEGADRVAVSVSGTGPGEVLVDAVQLTPAGGNGREEHAELGLTSSAADGIVLAGTAVSVMARGYGRVNGAARVVWRVEDAWGDDKGRGEVGMALEAGEVTEARLPVELSATGHYRVLAELRGDDGALSPVAEMLLALVPGRDLPTSSADAGPSRFGCNMENRPWLMRVARKIGMRWVFCAPPLFTKWFSAEPRPGEWHMYDDVVDAFERAGLQLVGNLADPPYWATHPGDERVSGPWPNPNYPANWADWEAYIRHVVEHYNPRITHWAVWNEPNHPGYLKLAEGEEWPAKHVELLRRTHGIVKGVDAELYVIGGTVTNPGALPALVGAGGLEFMDIAAFHWSSWSPDGYLRNTGEELGFLGPKDRWVNCIERITDAYTEAGASAPLWNTECHLTEADVEREFATQPAPPQSYKTPAMSALDAAAAVPRQHITEWAAGIEKTFAWLLATHRGPWQSRTAVTLLEWDRSPAAALVAYAVMTDLLSDAEFVEWERKTLASELDRPTFWTFTFRTPEGRLRAVWGNRDAERELVLETRGDEVRVMDMFGVERTGAESMSGVELRSKIVLRVGRYPYYVVDDQ